MTQQQQPPTPFEDHHKGEAIATVYYAPPNAIIYGGHDGTASLTVSPDITTGRWDVGICGCFRDCVPNCLMVTCLPFISVAQIAERMGIMRYSVVLVIMLVSYLLVVVLGAIALACSLGGTWSYLWSINDAYTSDGDSYPHDTAAGAGLSLGVGSIAYSLSSLGGFIFFLAVWQLRSKIRERFEIPGSCLEDCLCVWCCQCCTIAQMATHIKSYNPGSCDFGPPDTLPPYRPAQPAW